MSKVFVIDKSNDYKVRSSYEGTPKTKATGQWGALGDCFSIINAEDFITQGHTGPEMFQVMAHYQTIKPSFRKLARAGIAKKVFQALQAADIPTSDISTDKAPRTRDHSERVIKLLRKTFNGHAGSRRAKCYALITDGMTVELYITKAASELRFTRAQALGDLQKLAQHPTAPSVKIVSKK